MSNVVLENEQLWEKFKAVGNEMIVNGKGRRMFPAIEVKISHLEDDDLYALYISFVRKGSKKFINGSWVSNDKSPLRSDDNDGEETDSYEHPMTPKLGKVWSANTVTFKLLKVTNKRTRQQNQIYLDTFYEYVPRLSIFKIKRHTNHEQELVSQFDFESASFVAVTTYQNEEIKNLKVLHNKYATAFRKRKLQDAFSGGDSTIKNHFEKTNSMTEGNFCQELSTYKNKNYWPGASTVNNSMQCRTTQPGFEDPFWHSNWHFGGNMHNWAYQSMYGLPYSDTEKLSRPYPGNSHSQTFQSQTIPVSHPGTVNTPSEYFFTNTSPETNTSQDHHLKEVQNVHYPLLSGYLHR